MGDRRLALAEIVVPLGLVDRTLDGGADALAMTGRDGSQTVVADVAAADCGLPYACIPAGVRNHLAPRTCVQKSRLR